MAFIHVPYTESDLRGLKKADIASLISAQASNWPKNIKKFGQSTSKKQMVDVLLSPENGFTKAVPVTPPQGPRNAQTETTDPDDGEPLTPLAPSSRSSTLPPQQAAAQQQGHGDEIQDTGEVPLTRHPDPVPPTGEMDTNQSASSHHSPPTLPPQEIPVQPQDRLVSTNEAGINRSRSFQSSAESAQVYLLVEDRRFDPANKNAIPVEVQPTYNFGDMYIPSEAVVAGIQNAGILGGGGLVRMSCPFRLDPSFDEPFAINVGANAGMTILRHQDRLYVPDGSTLAVYVQHHDVEAPKSNTNTDQSFAPSTSANGPHPTFPASSSQPISPAHPQRQNAKRTTVSWLQEKLKQHKDYDFLKNSSNRVVQNPTVVRLWRFIADFHAVYWNARSEVSGTHVSKKAIAEAMNVGETWLSESLMGDRLVRIYGPNGPNMDNEVVEELNAVRDPPRGKKALLDFLQRWENEHPCIE